MDFLPLKLIDVGRRGRFQYLSSLAKSGEVSKTKIHTTR